MISSPPALVPVFDSHSFTHVLNRFYPSCSSVGIFCFLEGRVNAQVTTGCKYISFIIYAVKKKCRVAHNS